MSLDALKWAWSIQNVTSSEKLVLLSYGDRANEDHEAYPSWSRLMKDTCLCRKTIEKVLLSLQKKNFIFKTGERKGRSKQVYVYRLIGVVGREDQEKLSTTSSKNTTSTINSTSSNINPGTSSKNATGTSSKSTTQNSKKKPKRNPKANLDFSDNSNCIKSLKTLLSEKGVPIEDDLIHQVMFYVDKSKPQKDAQTSIHMAVHLIKANRWKIPHGYKGITSQSIRENDEERERQKQIQIEEDGKIFRRIKSEITMAERLKIYREQLHANEGRLPEANIQNCNQARC